MIAINWGSSNFRAYRLNAEGEVEAERSAGRGAVLCRRKVFQMLMAEVGDWISEGERKILMCGMVGARRGWKRSALCASARDLRAGGCWSDPAGVGFVGRAHRAGPDGNRSVRSARSLRGEETEIFGCANHASGHANHPSRYAHRVVKDRGRPADRSPSRPA